MGYAKRIRSTPTFQTPLRPHKRLSLREAAKERKSLDSVAAASFTALPSIYKVPVVGKQLFEGGHELREAAKENTGEVSLPWLCPCVVH